MSGSESPAWRPPDARDQQPSEEGSVMIPVCTGHISGTTSDPPVSLLVPDTAEVTSFAQALISVVQMSQTLLLREPM